MPGGTSHLVSKFKHDNDSRCSDLWRLRFDRGVRRFLVDERSVHKLFHPQHRRRVGFGVAIFGPHLPFGKKFGKLGRPLPLGLEGSDLELRERVFESELYRNLRLYRCGLVVNENLEKSKVDRLSLESLSARFVEPG